MNQPDYGGLRVVFGVSFVGGFSSGPPRLMPRAIREASLTDRETSATPETEELVLIYFTREGCPACADARQLIETLQQAFPELRVIEKDIEKPESRPYSRHLVNMFEVPDRHRGIAPAIFAAEGYLAMDEITFDQLANLLETSLNSSQRGEAWWELTIGTNEETSPTTELDVDPASDPEMASEEEPGRFPILLVVIPGGILFFLLLRRREKAR